MSSVIHKNTIDYGKYKYHVFLMTNNYFDAINKKESIMVGYKKGNFENLKNIEKEKESFIQNNTTIDVTAKLEEQKTETPAEFPGGMSALRKKIMENIDTSKIKPRKEPYKGTVHFNVWDDGSAADVFLEFEDKDFMNVVNDAIGKTLKGIKWKPGTKDGKPVKSRYKVPLTMTFAK